MDDKMLEDLFEAQNEVGEGGIILIDEPAGEISIIDSGEDQ